MSNKTVMYCKGSESIKLCQICKHNYYSNKDHIEKYIRDKNNEVFKIDNKECEIKNAKYFFSKIVN